MYGLFHNSYDYHKWKDLVCVAEEKIKLKKYYENLKSIYPLLNKQKSMDVDKKRTEQQHYVILKINKL